MFASGMVETSKYRKAVLSGDVAIRVRDRLRPINREHDLEAVFGKVARDHGLWSSANSEAGANSAGPPAILTAKGNKNV